MGTPTAEHPKAVIRMNLIKNNTVMMDGLNVATQVSTHIMVPLKANYKEETNFDDKQCHQNFRQTCLCQQRCDHLHH
eukprot:10114161-Ditylum_brightwellii.AAC.1